LVLSWWLGTSSAYSIPCTMLSEVLTKEHASTYVSFLDFVMKFLDLLSYIAFGFITAKEDCFFQFSIFGQILNGWISVHVYPIGLRVWFPLDLDPLVLLLSNAMVVSNLIELVASDHVVVSNLTFFNAPAYSIHPVYCKYVMCFFKHYLSYSNIATLKTTSDIDFVMYCHTAMYIFTMFQFLRI